MALLVVRIEYINGNVEIVHNAQRILLHKESDEIELDLNTNRDSVFIENWAKITVRAENGFPIEEFVHRSQISRKCEHKDTYVLGIPHGKYRVCRDCGLPLYDKVTVEEPVHS